MAGAEVRRLDQGLPCGQGGQRQRRGLDVAETPGHVRELARRRRRVLSVRGSRPGEPRHPEHAIAECEPGHAGTERDHLASDVGAENERRVAEESTGGSGLAVDRVDARGSDADQHLRRGRFRARHVDHLEHLRASKHLLTDRAHRGRSPVGDRVVVVHREFLPRSARVWPG